MIELRNVTKEYSKGNAALNGVSVKIERGKSVFTAAATAPKPGWDPVRTRPFLPGRGGRFNEAVIRTSIFVDPVPEMVEGAAACGARRVELYTEAYAAGYAAGREAAIAPYVEAAEAARRAGLGLTGGHALNLDNLTYFAERIPWCDEVSIGHALVCDALWYGMENTVRLYRRCLGH